MKNRLGEGILWKVGYLFNRLGEGILFKVGFFFKGTQRQARA